MGQVIAFKLNGEEIALSVPANVALVDVLREKIGLTSTKNACERGECGACTILLDGKPVNSCLVLAATVNGKEVTTVEGLGNAINLHPLQSAFYELLGAQCGFCTSGMLLSAKALLDENGKPSEDEVKQAISGNICRCTGYYKPIQAILAASKGEYDDPKYRNYQAGAAGPKIMEGVGG